MAAFCILRKVPSLAYSVWAFFLNIGNYRFFRWINGFGSSQNSSLWQKITFVLIWHARVADFPLKILCFDDLVKCLLMSSRNLYATFFQCFYCMADYIWFALCIVISALVYVGWICVSELNVVITALRASSYSGIMVLKDSPLLF